GVVLAHLEQHPLGPAGTCLLLAPGEQRAADADPLAPGADRVQVRRVASEHDPGVAEKRALAPSLRSLSLSPVLDGEDIAAGGVADLLGELEDVPGLVGEQLELGESDRFDVLERRGAQRPARPCDRKSTRLNSSHVKISYAGFCLKKKTRRA